MSSQPAPTNSGGFEPYAAPQDTLDQLEQLQNAKFPTPAKLAGPSCSTCGDLRAVVDGTLPDGRDRLVACRACFGIGPVAEDDAPIECKVQGCDQPATFMIEFASGGERPYCDGCAERAQQQIACAQRTPTPIFGEVIRGTDDAQWDRIPALTRGDLLRYIKQRIEPGGFLKAFLEADIDAARAVASVANERALPALAYWVYVYAPRESFGSADAVAAWLGQTINQGQSND